jgi:PRD1 phage membrane DNA delivery
MADTGIGRDLVEIASLLISVALVTLLVTQGSNTVKIIQAGGSTFNDLLRTITAQNGLGSYSYM